MINVLVTGGKGQLARCLNHLKSENIEIYFHFLDIEKLDITDYEFTFNYIKNNDLNFIVNCAAYTSVDKAEYEPNKAKMINVLGLKNLIKISEILKIKIIHISTDYVFDGVVSEELKEDHEPNPLSVYGKTKLEGENLILNSNLEAIIIRTSWLFSPYGNNFVKSILNSSKSDESISVIRDQWGKPTFGLDLAKIIIELINTVKSFENKIYHFSNKGVTNWYDFAKEIIELSKSKTTVIPINSSEYSAKLNRPKNVVLNTDLIETTLNLQIPNWKNSLKKCLNMINEQL